VIVRSVIKEKEKLTWEMNKITGVFLVFMLFLSLGVAINNSVAGGPTVVKVDPSLIEYHEDATGQQFTVAVKIVNVTNLYGFALNLSWDPTFLDYVSHSVHVPRDTYPDGVLWNPILWGKDGVNASAGTYGVAYSSRWPALSFNGSGTVFTMTFRVKYHPVQPEPDANITLELYLTELAAIGGDPIPHIRENGKVILYALSAGHDVAIIGIIPSKNVVGQGYNLYISVTVTNKGDFLETLNLTTYADVSLPIGDEIIVGKKEVSYLLPEENRVLTFLWTTTGIAKGNYTISALADPVLGETNTTDNTLIDGWILITKVGDLGGGLPPQFFNFDDKVDGKDLSLFLMCFKGTAPPEAMYLADLGGGVPPQFYECDGKVDGKDLSLFLMCFKGTGP